MTTVGSQDDVSRTPTPPRLSKSKYLSGLQCQKRLYLEIHYPSLATPPDASTQAILDMGTDVGEWARRRFDGGRLVEAGYRHTEAALTETALLMANHTVPAIFEAAIQADGVLIRVDILERLSPGNTDQPRWRLIEVKSSTKVKDVHLDDLSLQQHVLMQAGIDIAGCAVMRINTGYVYAGGSVDLTQLFAIDDVSSLVAERQNKVTERLATMKSIVTIPSIPMVEPDDHCQVPYECPFWNHCTKDKPTRWILNLPGSKKLATNLAAQGIMTIDEIPPQTHLSIVQRKVKDNIEWASKHLVAALGTVAYPVHHLDFETFNPAVPRYPGTRPYQAIPMQWSNHIEQNDETIVHHEFLHGEMSDPRRPLAEALLESLGDEGSICVYSPYEKSVIEQLAESLPDLRSELRSLIKRIWDLHPIVREHYYHPKFGGSFSLKEVLPAVVPSLRYDDLAIREGGQAAAEYYRMVFIETDWVERTTIRESLLRYCARDTLAMVELRRALRKKGEHYSEHKTPVQKNNDQSGQIG